jgi:hypothetical protein
MMRTVAAMAMILCWASPGATQTGTTRNAPASWSFAGSVYVYQVRDDRNYAQPTLTADRGWLHLETRYNYEDRDTGSLWLGYTAGGGDSVAWEMTPMLGGIFGGTAGIAPGYWAVIGWWKLEASSEGEYLFDVEDSSESFFYNWSELALAPATWWRIGLVTQRTRVYATAREVQRGLLAGVSVRNVDLAVHVFNPDDSRPTGVFSVAVAF